MFEHLVSFFSSTFNSSFITVHHFGSITACLHEVGSRWVDVEMVKAQCLNLSLSYESIFSNGYLTFIVLALVDVDGLLPLLVDVLSTSVPVVLLCAS